MDCNIFILFYFILVRTYLQYANSVWTPYNKVT